MGFKTLLLRLLLLLLSISRRATAPASSMDITLGSDSARPRLALVLRHAYYYYCCCRSQQSANFTNRAETLLQRAPETEHYDDRPPTYPQLMYRLYTYSTLTSYFALF